MTYFDENRAIVGRTFVPIVGRTFEWRKFSDTLPVPASAREAIVHIGLLGATGEVSYDDVEIKGVGVGNAGTDKTATPNATPNP